MCGKKIKVGSSKAIKICLRMHGYLRDIAVDNAMPVIHNKVIQLLVRNVVE